MNTQITTLVRTMTTVMTMGMTLGLARPAMLQSLPHDRGVESAIADMELAHSKVRGLINYLTEEERVKYPMLMSYLTKALTHSAEASGALTMARSYTRRIKSLGWEEL